MSSCETKKSRRKKKTTSKPYMVNDEILFKDVSDRNLVARILFNDMGYFVDIRRYRGLYPSCNGIRTSIENFHRIADVIINKENEIKYGPGAPMKTPELSINEEEAKLVKECLDGNNDHIENK